jgi:DNA polymerase III delta prime subunit
MTEQINAFAWSEKYRPRQVEDLIATPEIKAMVDKIINSQKAGDLLLVGPPGIGKTTIARLIVEKIDAEYLFLNASLEGNIDTLRNDIQSFASAQSLLGGRRYVILDEADYLTQVTQPALRSFMDTHKNNCGFILTANYLSKIIDPLKSRLKIVEFKLGKKDIPALAKQFFDRCVEILEKEGYSWDKECLARFIVKRAPDWRKCLIDLQEYAESHGKIDAGILGVGGGNSIDQLVSHIREKNFTKARQFIGENGVDQTLFEQLYKDLPPLLGEESIPPLILILAKHQFQAAFAADQEINAAACLAEIMAECRFQ